MRKNNKDSKPLTETPAKSKHDRYLVDQKQRYSQRLDSSKLIRAVEDLTKAIQDAEPSGDHS